MSNLPFSTGCVPSPKDSRDYMYSKLKPVSKTFPQSYSSRYLFKHGVRDQGPFGTCVGYGTAAFREIQEAADSHPVAPRLSPLHIYTECKAIDGIPHIEGTYIRTAMKVVTDRGVCREATLPYSLLKDIFTLPSLSPAVREEAKLFKNKAYAQVNSLSELKQSIIDNKASVFGVIVTENFFDTTQDGGVKMPEGRYLGSHCMCAVGWDDNFHMRYKTASGVEKEHIGAIEVINSHGEDFGDKGVCYIPYDYFHGRLLDSGMPYWHETWSGVDVLTPPQGANKIIIKIGSNVAVVDGVEVLLDTPAFIEPSTGRTLVPLRFMAEHFGYFVEWSEISQTVTMTKM